MTQYSGKIIRKTPVVPTQQSASGVWTTEDAAVAVRNNTWPVAGVPDPISRSCRFRASASAYYNRTPAIAGNQQKWTWSGWVKRGTFGQQQMFTAGAGTGGSPECYIDFEDNLNFQIFDGTSNLAVVRSTAVYRDPSAWYHVVVAIDTTQATAANRVLLYINGQAITSFAFSTYPTQNLNTQVNATTAHRISSSTRTSAYYWDGYMTEINFIDGQQLTPSSFGTTDPETGAWEPMQYRGTYGTNGFYIDFRDNTSTTTLGYDYSGNANNWTANNISLTAGSTYDSMLDVPTPWVGYAATTDKTAVTRGNYAVLNPLDYGGTQVKSIITEANLKGFDAGSGSYNSTSVASFGVTSGKFYCEFTSITAYVQAGILYGLPTSDMTAAGIRYYGINGIIYKDGVSQGTFATYTTNDIIGLALDADAKTIAFYKNNTLITTITYTSTNAVYLGALFPNTAGGGIYANFGQRPFTYTPPAGFTTLCATNLPDPTIKLGAQYMAASLWTGTGATLSIVNSGNNTTATTFAPDFVWIKDRSAARSHRLFDTVRAATKALFSDATDAETTLATDLTAFNSNGFTLGVGAGSNSSGETFVGWQWKAAGSTVSNTSGTITSTVSANTTAGFSIATYTGNATNNATFGHGLGVAPNMVIIKNRAAATFWYVFHSSLAATYNLYLNDGAAQQADNVIRSTSSTTVTVSSSSAVNASGQSMVAYCFAAVAGYSAFGSYTGNGSTDGPFVYTGFRPRFILTKNITTGGYWWEMVDSSREPINPADQTLYANVADSEYTSSVYNKDLLSNGFKMRGTSSGHNASGDTYVYAAFAENPFKYSNAR